jgi:hypothetical protein
MPDATVQVVIQGISLLPEDRFVNTLHFSEAAPLSWEVFADSIGPDIVAAWVALSGGSLFYPNTIAQRAFTVRIYNPDDPEPRQARIYSGALATNSGAVLPTECAVVLSYYSTLNTARRRGRIYVGPCTSGTTDGTSHVTLAVRTKLLDLATALADVGPDTVDWQTFSRVENLRRRVTNAWVDDAWDTQRRRGIDATTRSTREVQGGP